ncbi:hypothetical protein ACO22_03954 [Paracoccidioides brasiliensis]|uniref:Nucleoporin NSP1 n=1 Tax=Paracoccidioides brasiliensis TaxID=121759 RepID=A0A1D2JEH5_PARBR|nr:hypothetical protein ACO22_03954 [Paracoccidioides brasiliensis]
MSSPFQFGTPSTSGASNTPTFGTAGASPFSQNASGNTGGVFGSVGATPATSSSATPLFGGSTTPATGQTGSMFGGQSSKHTFGVMSGSTSSPFAKPSDQGQTGGQTSTTPLFGAANQTPKPTEPVSSSQAKSVLFGELGKNTPSTGSLFGNATPAASGATSVFGNMSTTPAKPPPQSSTGSSLFGNQGSTKPGESVPLFGQKPSSNPFGGQGAITGTLSSTSASTPATTTTTLFPNAPQSQTTSSGNLFNVPATKGQNSETEKSDAKPSALSTAGTSTTPQTSGSPFSVPSTSGTQSPQKQSSFPSSKPTFGTLTPATPAETAQKPLFGSQGGSSASTSTPSTTATTTTTATPAGGLFVGISTPKTNAPKESTTPASTPGQAASGMFNLNKPSTTTAPTTSTPATTSTTDGKTTITAPPTTDTTTATTTACTTPTTTATASGLGASIVGPPPPAQSRLKNKTMDEIITRWATDLTKYQKEFQEQAEQVATWDRMLVDNGTKVQKLYGNTVDAERATQEVERQLASVEGQQDELSSWLDRYEQEVQALLSKQVGTTDSLQGPDQERERTYKLAERLSERLNEMGQDLTSMIEEVNSASSTLNKTTKADEPISQIVRILNSHLSQLQLIDQGTANLHAKIAAAQKLGSSLSVHQHQSPYGQYRNGTSNGLGGGGAAEDFYKAYMGRR